LAPVGDINGLSAAIAEILQSPHKRMEMAESSHRVVMDEYTLERQVRRYIELYKAALGGVSPWILDESSKILGGSNLKATNGLLVDRVGTSHGLPAQ
jgi:hypothetical protein